MLKDKGLIIGAVFTAILITGGVFLMSRDNPETSSVASVLASSDVLAPKDEHVTGGIVDGNYLPANPSAKITLVEFGSYQCPACGVYNILIKQLLTEFAGSVNYVFRNYPLSYHTEAFLPSQAAEAAGLQGKYWQMHDKLYELESEWSEASDPTDIFINYAQSMDLDIDKFKADFGSDLVKDKIQSDITDGNSVKVKATPTLYLNGVKIENLQGSYQDLKKAVSDLL